MAKNKRKEVEYNGVLYDSTEEVEFVYWLEDAVVLGLVEPDWIYQPITWTLAPPAKINIERKLKTKTRNETRTLYQQHVYTPDFLIKFTKKTFDICTGSIIPPSYSSFSYLRPNSGIYIDVKGSFNKTKRSFSIDQKWVFSKYGVYVHEIVPKKLFIGTWVPELARYTPVKRDVRKPYLDTPTLDEYRLMINPDR